MSEKHPITLEGILSLVPEEQPLRIFAASNTLDLAGCRDAFEAMLASAILDTRVSDIEPREGVLYIWLE